MKIKLLCSIFFVTTFCFCQTKVDKGVQFNDVDVFEGTELMLNGAGNKGKYYAIGLYLNFEVDGVADGVMVAEKNTTMALTIKITSGALSSQELKDIFRNGLERATDGNSYLLENQIRDFLYKFPKEINKHDIFILTYTKDKGITISRHKEFIATVGDFEFKKAFFKIWLGDNPVDMQLKKDLLKSVPVNPVLGRWKSIDKRTGVAISIVEFYMIKNQLYGVIREMLRQSERDNICYDCTGDDKNQKVEGLVIMKELIDKGDGKFVDGNFTNIKTGAVSNCQVWIDKSNEDILNVKYKGGGGVHQWMKIKEPEMINKTSKF